MTVIAPARVRLALAFGVTHWLLLVLIQCENIVRYLLPVRAPGATLAGYAMGLPFLQTENLMLAAAMGLVACLLAGWLATRVVALALWTLVALFVVFDQVYYKVFFDHFRPSIIEGQVSASQLKSSFGSELDAATYLNLSIVIVCVAFLAWRFVLGSGRSEATEPAGPPRGAWLLPSVVVLLFVSGIPSVRSSAYNNLQHHPLVVLAHDTMRRSLIGDLRDGGGRTYSGESPLETEPEDRDTRMTEVLRACRLGSRPPNVLLIILESVGSRQLLQGDGLPSDRVTPHLAQVARQGVVFDSVYSVFPGSVRTHVAMTTGGRHLTWGSVYELFGYPYEGPTLPRAFARAGYATALFSGQKLESENMAAFMGKAGYETLYDYGLDRSHHTPEVMISSWGAREEYTIMQIERWLDSRDASSAGTGRPFFLNYLTAATHHPYGVPDWYAGPFHDSDPYSRYRNSLHYTDQAIGKLLDALAARNLLSETIVAITGDHGQAFGDLHPLNFTHKNRLYEENIRSFLIVVPPARLSVPVVSPRVATTGDIMPTLLAAAGLAPADVPGRALLAESFVPEAVFFHKNMPPEQWGLRLGAWKYIARIRDRSAELFDLARDPNEQVNLAHQNPDRVARFDAFCRRQFLERDRDYTARLTGYRPAGGHGLSADDVRTPGPKSLAVGLLVKFEGTPRFVDRSSIQPHERPVAHARWVAYDRETPLEFRWRSPSGLEYREGLTVIPESAFAHSAFPGPVPMEPGNWMLSIREPGGGPILRSAVFEVAGFKNSDHVSP